MGHEESDGSRQTEPLTECILDPDQIFKEDWQSEEIVQELKDIVDKPTILQCLPRRCNPNVTFDYKDGGVHNHFFTLIKWRVEKLYSAEEALKLLNLWITFVEPFLSLPAREKLKMHPSEDEETLDAAEEGTPERTFLSCKPLCAAVQQAHTPFGGPCTSAAHVLYGNEDFYRFFLLHHIIYDRLRHAVRFSAEKVAPSNGWAAVSATGAQAEADAEKDRPSALDAEGIKIHNDFMELVSLVIQGSIHSRVYEDRLHNLFGTNGYVLSSLDKLIYKLAKQLQELWAGELNAELRELHQYEMMRTFPFTDAVYAANADMLLSDGYCFRFELRPDKVLAVWALYPPQKKQGGKGQKSDGDPGVQHATLVGFVEEHTQSTDSPLWPEHLPFLRRSLPQHSAMEDILRNTTIIPGLETIIGSYLKPRYVLETEDIVMRKRRPRHAGPRRSERLRAKRTDKTVKKEHFRRWIQGRLNQQ